MYAKSTDSAIVAIPLAIIQCNSDGVMIGRNGLIVKGASVWPGKKIMSNHAELCQIMLSHVIIPKIMLAAAFIDSHGVVPMVI